MRGKIIDYKIDRGFGFILGEDGKKYFFHISNTKTPLEIDIKVLVDFECNQSPKGLVAENIVINAQSIMKNMFDESFNHMNSQMMKHINTHTNNHTASHQKIKANPIFEISDINDEMHYINVEYIASYSLDILAGYFDDDYDNYYGNSYYDNCYDDDYESYYYWLDITLKSGTTNSIHLASSINTLGYSSHETEEYIYAYGLLEELKELMNQS